MRLVILVVCALFLTSCATNKKEVEAKKQVKGLQKMCKESAPAIKKRQAKNALYNRLRRKKGITEFTEKLYIAHKTNNQIGHMFEHVDADHFQKNVVAFLTVGTGGKGKYTGRSMKAVHANLGITNSDFMAAGGDVTTVMKGMKYGENEIQEVVCALVSFIPVVVKQ